MISKNIIQETIKNYTKSSEKDIKIERKILGAWLDIMFNCERLFGK